MPRHAGKMNLEALEVLFGKATGDLNKLGNVLLEALLIMLVVKEDMQGNAQIILKIFWAYFPASL
jgi:hypothetical protein